MNLEKMLDALNPGLIERFKRAIEIGKWSDGNKLSNEQLEICMQAVIRYELAYVSEENRTAYVPPKSTPCSDDGSEEEKLKWQ